MLWGIQTLKILRPGHFQLNVPVDYTCFSEANGSVDVICCITRCFEIVVQAQHRTSQECLLREQAQSLFAVTFSAFRCVDHDAHIPPVMR